MNILSTADRARIIACLVEGNSQRAEALLRTIGKWEVGA